MSVVSLRDKTVAGAVAALWFVVAAPAAAEVVYRPGAPAVLKPTASNAGDAGDAGRQVDAIEESFAAAYRKAGAPRLAVFWDRAFGEASDAQQPLSEISAAQFAAGYARPFLEAGAAFIDRGAIMQLTRAKMLGDRQLVEPGDPKNHHDVLIEVLKMKSQAGADAAGDRQFVETEALKGHADLVIEISMIPSAESELGAAFRVLAVEVKTGAVKVNFLEPLIFAAREQWTAVKGGYILAAPAATPGGGINFADAGHLIAMQTMRELTRAWR